MPNDQSPSVANGSAAGGLHGGNAVTASDRNHYTADQRTRALWVYAETGSVESACRETGIPHSTIYSWLERNPEDVEQECEALRLAVKATTAHKHAILANLALDAGMDRILHGDYQLDSDGVMRRVPVKLKDLTMAASIHTDKHVLLTGFMAQGQRIDSTLKALADQLSGVMKAIANGGQQAAPNPDDQSEPALG